MHSSNLSTTSAVILYFGVYRQDQMRRVQCILKQKSNALAMLIIHTNQQTTSLPRAASIVLPIRCNAVPCAL